MQQHMIPQDVTGYKFNLFGILNLSQFLQLIIPCVIAFLVWKLGTPLVIAIPIMVVLVLYGVLAAFVPINDRPLSHWVTAFLTAMYAPTKFYWRRQSFVPDFFNFQLNSNIANQTIEPEISQAESLLNRRTKTAAFLHSMERVEMDDPLELKPDSHVADLLAVYDQIPVATQVVATKQTVKPNLNSDQILRPRQMQTAENIFGE